MEIIEDRLVELEIKAAFQDDVIQALNQIVSRQQVQLERLEISMNMLTDRLKDAASSSDLTSNQRPDEPPPHY